MAGILPFGAMFIELFFIFTAIWENQYYYLFGFLFLVFIILVVSVSQIAVVMVYFQLCGEDYHWWWRTFIVSGGSAFYVLAYSVFYFITKLDITEFIPSLLYFGYTFLIVFTFWILTGTVGFFAAYWFIVRIYGAIKID
ncbi:transmembrane 9 superfamily member [Elysia marginata]|uniref:Transmembrane 9 superfamily member n=1 Tax=Elysia marginata TaxID=1093978 RepID=A0AAV4GP19_9GAST|nr:transmembrane 9 superfamily member [Elysia marginata]